MKYSPSFVLTDDHEYHAYEEDYDGHPEHATYDASRCPPVLPEEKAPLPGGYHDIFLK